MATARVFHDRIGRPITDPRIIEARTIKMHMRRLITLGCKAGKPWDHAATVGEIAKSTKLTAERVVQVIREHGMWLWGFSSTDGPMEDWHVFEDGE